AILRLAGTFIFLDWLVQFSFLAFLAGIAVLFLGKKGLQWAWPAVGFLLFMIPLPYRVEMALANPLRRLATVSSTYVLQTLGIPAVAEGTTIVMDEVKLEVVDACSGLSMLVAFVALSTAVACLIKRPLWERILIVVSSLPVAIIVNVL